MAPTLDSFKKAEYSPTREPQRVEEKASCRMVACDAIKNEFLCAICLGLLKKTVTSQECLHRFCQECIRTSLQVGNQECPTCRAKLTEATLRADSVFDNLIEKLFPQADGPESQNLLAEAPEGHDEVFKKHTPTDENKNQTKSPPDSSGKRKRQSDKSNTKATGDSAVTSCLNSDIKLKDVIPKAKLKTNKQTPTKAFTPKRRSLRLEALKMESEKNETEVAYNRRLSDGSAHVFFSLLELRPRDCLENDSGCNKKEFCSEKEEWEVTNVKSMEDIKSQEAAVNKKETLEANERRIQQNRFTFTVVRLLDDESLQHKKEEDGATVSNIPIRAGQDDAKTAKDVCPEASTLTTTDSNLNDSIPVEAMESKDNNKTAKIPKKKAKLQNATMPLRRSKRASVIAQNIIRKQKATKKES